MKLGLTRMYANAVVLNRRNIIELCASTGLLKPTVLDIGCDDGQFSLAIAESVNASEIHGVEIVDSKARLAESKGVEVQVCDVTKGLPFRDATFDLVHANQVIEHVSNVDFMMIEAERVLRPGGFFVMSTENGSSWCNIAASVLGWQQFSLTNVSARKNGIGNPFALHRMSDAGLSSWTHKTIFNYRGLKEFCEVHGFQVERIRGAGYFPLPARIGGVDSRHSHFLTMQLRKP